MPHLIIEYSRDIIPESKLLLIMQALHQRLGHTDTIDIDRIKTRLIPLNDYIIGKHDSGSGCIIHITVKLMTGRPTELRKSIAETLQSLVKEYLQDIVDHAAVTVEIVELDIKTYAA